ncbi:MAG: tRNA(Arg) A34 adenosine deaminase TadA [Rickettsiales bacterium]|jgi:tRNA(Arg) A34 adenosine deaminase TadA
MNKPNPFIIKALEQAKIAFNLGEVPVGAIVVCNNKIIASAHNQNISLNDPTAHAEILALRQACKILKNHRLDECDLYVSLEPCTMCAGAISHARIRRIYYSASDPKSGGVENGAKVFSHPQCHHKPEIYGQIGAKDSEDLLKEFFSAKRNP